MFSAYALYQSPFVQWLNDLFSTRIWLNWYALNNFDITLFGQVVDFQITGVHNTLTDNWNVSTTIDCTYVAGLIRFGLVGIALWLFATYQATKRSWERGGVAAACAAFALAACAFTESQLMDPLIFFPILGILPLVERPADYILKDDRR